MLSSTNLEAFKYFVPVRTSTKFDFSFYVYQNLKYINKITFCKIFKISYLLHHTT